MRTSRTRLALATFGASLLAMPGRAEVESPGDFFESKVRPILAANCQECHGVEKPKGKLSLVSRAAVLAGGRSGPAAVAGAPDESLLIEALSHESEPRMPPKGRLPAAEIDTLRRWVALGLPWPDSGAVGPAAEAPAVDRGAGHWAFRPVRAVEPPPNVEGAGPSNPIDRFVRTRLQGEGLGHSPEADRRTLIRRVTFDLTGLPPTPEEVAAFVSDERPDAYERLVDQLLTSPGHGEQWARHWLDVARYSDTKGYVYAREEARWVHAWAYRDWVVRAFNEDMPYDRFLMLQMAADQVSTEPADRAAMGFLTIGRRFLGVTHEIIDDRIDVVTRGMLGLTVACARCHDHKFDPIPTADYYALYGVFRNCAERVEPAFAGEEPAGTFADGLRERRGKLAAKLAEERAAAAGRVRGRIGDYLLAQVELDKYPEEGFDQLLAPGDLFPSFVRRWRDAIDEAVERGDPVFAAWNAFLNIPADEYATRSGDACRLLRELSDSAVNPIVAAAFGGPPAGPREVVERYGEVFRGIISEWEGRVASAKGAGEAPPEGLADPSAEAIRGWLYGPGSPCEVPDEPIVGTEWFFPTETTVELWKLQGEVDRWMIEGADAPAYATTLVDRSPPVDSRIFRRGDPSNLGDEVPRHFLRVIAGPEPEPFREGSGRLELARAIVDPANPLTARVAVNRVWMHHFGAGLVRTPGDFGTRAEPPSHPELLDWLAARFVADGWSLKALHRLIVTSETYRQAAAGAAGNESMGRDPENRLLGRMRPRRLTFEELRDALLAATGELDGRVGGKPSDLLKAPYSTRRTLYGLTDREHFPGVFRAFDVANPDLLIPQRNETTVPQQALFFLNNPFLLEQAKALAARGEIAEASSPEERVRRLYARLYQREPTASQIEAAIAMAAAAGSDGWVQVAQVLMMTNEFTFVD